jgi:hypothetical protein
MSAPGAVNAWQWPADVLDFAVKHHLDTYLDPLLEATRRVFPTVRDIRVLLECDAEARDLWYIVFEASVPEADLLNYVEAHGLWIRECRRVCPAPVFGNFVLTLLPVTP